jgi:exopolysaccharide production protein ExoZ
LVICIASALLLIAAQGIFPPSFVSFSGSRIPVLGMLSFCLVTTASLLSQAGWDTRLASLVLIGDASYILYLVHPYCEYSLDRAFGSRLHWVKSATPTGALLGVSASILLAVLIHLYGERPVVRYLNRSFGGKRKSIEFATPS